MDITRGLDTTLDCVDDRFFCFTERLSQHLLYLLLLLLCFDIMGYLLLL